MEKQLPKNWVEVQLIDILEVLENGSRPKGGVQGILEGVPSFGGEHLNSNGGFKLGNLKYVPNSFAEKMNRGRIKQNDILIVKDGATTGKTSFVDNDFPFDLAFVNEHVFICRTFSNLNSKSIFYFLFSKIGFDRIMDNFTGSAQGGINQKFACNTLIPLPPLAEQNRIVTKLDALFLQLEAIKNSMDNVPLLLKDFRQQVLNQAVTGKLTEEWRKGKKLESGEDFIKKVINLRKENSSKKIDNLVFKKAEHAFEVDKSWSFGYLQFFGEFTRGKSKHRPRNDEKLFGGKYPFIQTGEVSRSNGYITNYKNTYSEFGLSQSRLFPKGTLCITIAANIAETAILGFDSCFPDSVVGYLPYENLYSAEFAMYYLNIIQKDLEHYAPATAQKNINLGILFDVPFPVPPHKEQIEIISRVKSLFAKANAIEKQYESLKAKIDSLPQVILHKAFKGELTEQLDSDGDARELLKEIQALKATSGKVGKKVGKTVKHYNEKEVVLDRVAEPNNTNTFTEIMNQLNFDYEIAAIVSLTFGRFQRSYGKKYIHKMFSNIELLNTLPVFTELTFEENGWGMFSPQIKKAIEEQKFIQFEEINDNQQVLQLNFKYFKEVSAWMKDEENKEFISQVNEMLTIYENPIINKKMDNIELFNTVLECMKVLKTDNFQAIYEKMKNWPMKEEGFETKADKFKELETQSMIDFIKEIKN